MFQIRKIIAPIDFSDAKDLVLDRAISLARDFGASVIVVHAYQIPVYGFPDGAIIPGAEFATEMSNAAQSQLDSAVAARASAGVPLRGILREGIAWEEVNRVAADEQADLIVVATHGRRGLSHALLGSTAERIVRTASVPVLTIPMKHT